MQRACLTIYQVPVYLCMSTCVCHSVITNSATPWTVAHQGPLSVGFPRQEYWCGLPFPSPGDLPNPGIEPVSPAWEGGFFTAELPEKSLKCDCGSFHCSGHRNQKPVCDKPQKSFHEHRIA